MDIPWRRYTVVGVGGCSTFWHPESERLGAEQRHLREKKEKEGTQKNEKTESERTHLDSMGKRERERWR
jgi:hypothetical protein